MKQIVFIDTEGTLDSIIQEIKKLPKMDLTISEKDISTEILVVLDSCSKK